MILRRHASRGTTLLELLMTVAVVSLLLTMTFEIFRTGVALQTKGETQTRVDEALWLGLHEVCRELPEAVPIYTMNGGLLRLGGGDDEADAVLQPRPGETEERLEFLELDPVRVDPLRMQDFVATNPAFYRKVSYFAEGDSLWREASPYDPHGTRFRAADPPMRVVRCLGRELSLRVEAMEPAAGGFVEGMTYRITLGARAAGQDDDEESPREVTGYAYLRAR